MPTDGDAPVRGYITPNTEATLPGLRQHMPDFIWAGTESLRHEGAMQWQREDDQMRTGISEIEAISKKALDDAAYRRTQRMHLEGKVVRGMRSRHLMTSRRLAAAAPPAPLPRTPGRSRS